MILALFPGLLSEGGVARFGRQTAAALATVAADRGAGPRFLSLNDARGEHTCDVGGLPFRVVGHGGSKPSFAASAVRASRESLWTYLQHPFALPLVPLLRAAGPRAPVRVTLHGIDGWGPLPPLHRAGFRFTRGLHTTSRYCASRCAAAQGIPVERFALIPPVVDPGFLDMLRSDKDPFPQGVGPTLLTVARLAASERYKGVDVVLRSLPRLRKRFPGLRYVVVGDGDDRPRLEALATGLRVSDAVHFVGRLGDEALAATYLACDVFVMPSRGEGFGIAYLEAMAAGKPVVGPSTGAPAEFLRDGVHGLLAEPEDPAAVADAVARILSDPPLASRMGAAGQATIESDFGFGLFTARWKALVASDLR